MQQQCGLNRVERTHKRVEHCAGMVVLRVRLRSYNAVSVPSRK